VAGGACIAGAALWFLLAAREGGFLLGALLSLFSTDEDLEKAADRGLYGRHWEDVKGPFYLAVFGLGLIMIAQRLGGAALTH